MRFLRRNLISAYAAYAASILAGLVTVPLIVRAVGVEGYGIWAFIGSIVVFLGLLDLGVGPSLVRFAATYRGAGSPGETSALASTAVVVYGVVALASLPVAVGLAWAVPAALGLEGDLVWAVRITTLLVVGTVVARFPLGIATSLLLAHQRFDVVNAANILSALAYVALVAGFLLEQGSLVVLGGIALGTTVLRLALPLAWLPRELPGLRLRRSLVSRERLRELLGFSWHNFLIHVAGKVVFSLDVVIVGIVLGATAAALYGIPAKLFALAFGAGAAATDLLFPVFAELEGREERGHQRRLVLRGLRLGMALMSVIALPLVFIPDQLIEAWIGEGFADSAPVAALLGVALLLHLPAHVLSQYLVARARQRELAVASIAVVVANTGLSIALAYAVGIWGVALATVATEAVFVLALMPRLVVSAAGPTAAELAGAVFRPLAAALPAAALVLGAASRLLEPDGLLELTPVGIVWIVLAGAVIWRIGVDEDDRAAMRVWLAARTPSPTLPAAETGP